MENYEPESPYFPSMLFHLFVESYFSKDFDVSEASQSYFLSDFNMLTNDMRDTGLTINYKHFYNKPLTFVKEINILNEMSGKHKVRDIYQFGHNKNTIYLDGNYYRQFRRFFKQNKITTFDYYIPEDYNEELLFIKFEYKGNQFYLVVSCLDMSDWEIAEHDLVFEIQLKGVEND